VSAEERGERFWWAVLVRACEQEATEGFRAKRDMDAWHLAHEAANAARHELIKLGLNIDDVFHAADAEFLRLFNEAKVREAERKKEMVDGDRLLDEAAKLITKHEGSAL
jgi:hypothetical protein